MVRRVSVSIAFVNFRILHSIIYCIIYLASYLLLIPTRSRACTHNASDPTTAIIHSFIVSESVLGRRRSVCPYTYYFSLNFVSASTHTFTPTLLSATWCKY